MGEIRCAVSNLVQTLEAEQNEAAKLANAIHTLHDYLEQESKTIIQEGLERLLNRIGIGAAKVTGKSVVVLVSPDGKSSVGETHNINSDSWLDRLKSRGFYILTPDQFLRLIDLFKSSVAEGNWIPAIEFLRANTESPSLLEYSVTSYLKGTKQPGEASASLKSKLSGFLPAPFPHPPLPRGLFKS